MSSPIGRSDLLAYVAATYAEMATQLLVQIVDNPAGAHYAISQTLDQLRDSSRQDDKAAAYALMDLYFLRRLMAAAAARVDIQAEGASPKTNQIYNQIAGMLEKAEKAATAAGFTVAAGKPAAQLGVIALDYLEPWSAHPPYNPASAEAWTP